MHKGLSESVSLSSRKKPKHKLCRCNNRAFGIWCQATPQMIVDANMRELLKQPAFYELIRRSSTRMCIVLYFNELNLDWRWRCSVFWHQIIDFDSSQQRGNCNNYCSGNKSPPIVQGRFNIACKTSNTPATGGYRRALVGVSSFSHCGNKLLVVETEGIC